jgi:hypothetical protein
VNANNSALSLDHAEVRGSAFLRQGFRAKGAVHFLGARIDRDLWINDAVFEADGGIGAFAIFGADAAIGDTFSFQNVELSGGVFLFKLSTSTLLDDVGRKTVLGSWASAEPLTLEGFSYDRILGRWDSALRIRWLQKAAGFDPGSWQRLIDVYRAHGRDDDARRAAIAMQNDRLKRAYLPWPRKLGRWILRVTIGHGYRPWLAAVWAVGVILAFALAVWQAPAADLVPTEEGAMGSPQPIVYAADTFMPIIDFGEADQWSASGWLQSLEWIVILLGWVLSTIFVAGFTRIVRSV